MSQALESFLDSGSSFEGRVVFSGVVRIDGHFRGDASAEGTLVIGESGAVEADLEVTALIVNGRYHGQVTARERIEIGPHARVDGRVITPRLLIQDGAELNASVEMIRHTP